MKIRWLIYLAIIWFVKHIFYKDICERGILQCVFFGIVFYSSMFIVVLIWGHQILRWYRERRVVEGSLKKEKIVGEGKGGNEKVNGDVKEKVGKNLGK